MYLLAEDEGNEEEILRLLESESPGGSPHVPHNNSSPTSASCTSMDVAQHRRDKLVNFALSSLSSQESAAKKTSDGKFVLSQPLNPVICHSTLAQAVQSYLTNAVG